VKSQVGETNHSCYSIDAVENAWTYDDYDDNNNNNYYCLLQLGCNPVAVVILHVYKT